MAKNGDMISNGLDSVSKHTARACTVSALCGSMLMAAAPLTGPTAPVVASLGATSHTISGISKGIQLGARAGSITVKSLTDFSKAYQTTEGPLKERLKKASIQGGKRFAQEGTQIVFEEAINNVLAEQINILGELNREGIGIEQGLFDTSHVTTGVLNAVAVPEATERGGLILTNKMGKMMERKAPTTERANNYKTNKFKNILKRRRITRNAVNKMESFSDTVRALLKIKRKEKEAQKQGMSNTQITKTTIQT
ncbi:hypothetical protein EIN_333560, partial [Entamoeba invadens IP1]